MRLSCQAVYGNLLHQFLWLWSAATMIYKISVQRHSQNYFLKPITNTHSSVDSSANKKITLKVLKPYSSAKVIHLFLMASLNWYQPPVPTAPNHRFWWREPVFIQRLCTLSCLLLIHSYITRRYCSWEPETSSSCTAYLLIDISASGVTVSETQSVYWELNWGHKIIFYRANKQWVIAGNLCKIHSAEITEFLRIIFTYLVSCNFAPLYYTSFEIWLQCYYHIWNRCKS